MPPAGIDELRKKLDALDLKGKNVVPFKGLPVMEKAFFPGGNGLYLGSSANITIGKTLILGSNFGCVKDFDPRKKDETVCSKTWVGRKPGFGLKGMLPRTPIRLEECFFTNAWPFLHEGGSNDASKLIKPWLSDKNLMKECTEFFTTTISTVKPKLIVVLGTGASAFISKVWPHRFEEWGGCTIASMDRKPMDFVDFEGESIVCTAITHPSAHDLNAKNSIDGEISLLIKAAEEAGIAIS